MTAYPQSAIAAVLDGTELSAAGAEHHAINVLDALAAAGYHLVSHVDCPDLDAIERQSYLGEMMATATVRHLVASVRAAWADADQLAVEVDRWGLGDFHFGPMPRDPGVVEALRRHADAVAARGQAHA